MAKFAKGAAVRQILPPPIRGTVERYDIDQETGDVQVLVVWPDANGDGVQEERYFTEAQIEADE